MSNDVRHTLYETALAAGIPILSGDTCCRLLAWVYVYGGGNEQVALEGRLRESLLYAQKRLNINGGEIPDLSLVNILKDYIKELDGYNRPAWLIALEKEFNIRSN
jgi:hypothetical protein